MLLLLMCARACWLLSAPSRWPVAHEHVNGKAAGETHGPGENHSKDKNASEPPNVVFNPLIPETSCSGPHRLMGLPGAGPVGEEYKLGGGKPGVKAAKPMSEMEK